MPCPLGCQFLRFQRAVLFSSWRPRFGEGAWAGGGAGLKQAGTHPRPPQAPNPSWALKARMTLESPKGLCGDLGGGPIPQYGCQLGRLPGGGKAWRTRNPEKEGRSSRGGGAGQSWAVSLPPSGGQAGDAPRTRSLRDKGAVGPGL